jgi:hypothetical protein
VKLIIYWVDLGHGKTEEKQKIEENEKERQEIGEKSPKERKTGEWCSCRRE